MRHLSSLLGGLAKFLCTTRKEKVALGAYDRARKTVESMAKEARKYDMMLRSYGTMRAEASGCFVSTFSKRGEKGVNQDCFIIWQEFGCQEDMIFCGVFDGHGPWGHFVAKSVRDSLPVSLLCSWQECLALKSLAVSPEFNLLSDKNLSQFDVWKQSFLKSCAAVDEQLQENHSLDSLHSGTTALTIIKQGQHLIISNVGDSRAVLATIDEDGNLIAVPLTYELKPNLPQEAERIRRCHGRVFCLDDEPGVHRLWLPSGEMPGLAMSRAFGDHCVKRFGLISEPEVTHRSITSRDKFVVLATDGVWDVVSNEEAVMIVSTAPERGKSAKRLVDCATRAWQRKRRNIARDDCSAICLFFDSSSPFQRFELS